MLPAVGLQESGNTAAQTQRPPEALGPARAILQMSKEFLSPGCVISLRSLAHHFPIQLVLMVEPEKILRVAHSQFTKLSLR